MGYSTNELLRKSADGVVLDMGELEFLLGIPAESEDSYRIMAQGRKISDEVSDGKAEVHAQLALNLGTCLCECQFCSFAGVNKIFTEEIRLTRDEAVSYAKQFENGGANAIYIMTTAMYPLDLFIEMSQEIRRCLKSKTMMIANVGDQSFKNAARIKDVGYTGVYHALRLREGSDTGLDPEKRKASIRNFQEAGLQVGTCVEPAGPEHSNRELAELISFTASLKPAFSGAARRIAIPGTEIAKRGMISELRMAQIVAVTRLGMPRTVTGNCTHEPCILGATAGANLFWAELGANPRDVVARTEEGRGDNIENCVKLFTESGWNTLKGKSSFFKS